MVIWLALYDIEAEYKKEKFTYASLCQELMDEYEVRTGEDTPGEVRTVSKAEYYKSGKKTAQKQHALL